MKIMSTTMPSTRITIMTEIVDAMALCAAIAICCYSLIIYRLPAMGPQPGR